MTRVVGYTRELTPGSGTEADAEQLMLAGVAQVYSDDAVAGRKPPGLTACLGDLAVGDTLLVTSAAMLAPTVSMFLATMSGVFERHASFQSLSEPALCTGGASSVDPAAVFLALETLRKQLAGAQIRAGMATATAQGRRPGRPTVMTIERTEMAAELRRLGRSVTHIALVLGVSPNAVQRALRERGPIAEWDASPPPTPAPDYSWESFRTVATDATGAVRSAEPEDYRTERSEGGYAAGPE